MLAQRAIALAGEDQRQGDGAVQEVRAAGLAGALRRARDVEDVVEELEREARSPPEGLERLVALASGSPITHAHSNSRAVFSSQRSR